MSTRGAAILCAMFLHGLVSFARPNLFLNHCQFEASANHGEVETEECGLRESNQTTDFISVSNMAASWSVIDDDSDNLLLTIVFSTRGSGIINMNLMSSPRYVYPFFCGRLKMDSKNSTASNAMHVWLRCNQHSMKLDDKMTLFIDGDKRDRRRNAPDRVEVDLPGCTLPQFMHSDLCKEEEESKIRFHARRHKQTIRVALSRGVYKSRYKDEKRARSRRYRVAIMEEPPVDTWLGVEGGEVIQMNELKYPERKVRFRSLQLKNTYIISVWKIGETKRFVKKITLC